MGDPKEAIHGLLYEYYNTKGIVPTLQVARELLRKPVPGVAGQDIASLNASFNGEVCETVLQVLIIDFMKRNPKKTEHWRYNKGVILSDLDSRSSKFLTEIDALLMTPECFYVFECKSYAGDKKLIGQGTIVAKNKTFDVFKQNALHLKILNQWVGRFSQHPKYQMVLFDFSTGEMDDQRAYKAKQDLMYVSESTLFDLLRESRLGVWRPEDIDSIHKQFDRETKALRMKHLDYVTHLNHK